MREVIRRNWRFWVTLAEVLLLTTFFAHYLGHRQTLANERQTLANQRNERQRTAICAILATIPGHIPAEISRARTAFARPGHPHDCTPIPGAARPKPTPIPVTINGTPGVIVVQPGPVRTVTVTPTPRPTPTRTPGPTPKPSPSPLVCIAGHCIH